MFQLSQYLNHEAFQKIGDVANELGMRIPDDIANILELEIDLVRGAIQRGFIPHTTKNDDEAFERLYRLTVLFNYLLKMAAHDSEALLNLWEDTTMYDSAIVKPPWYRKGLKNYLFENKYHAVKSCIEWIREY